MTLPTGPHRSAQSTLLRLIAGPAEATSLSLAEWDSVIRLARRSRLLGVLNHTFDSVGVLAEIPEPVRGHFQAAANIARYRAQMMRMELRQLASALARLGSPVVLLKGSAYLMQELPMAQGRMPGDVDLMVPRDRLDEAERALLQAGWESQVGNDYDQRYYREWSHELPPLRFPGHALEVDLHHTITPITGRLRPDASAFFADAVPIQGSGWHALCPRDQVLHAAVHLFQDSDLAVRLHELVDFDRLLRHRSTDREFGSSLLDRAARLGLERPLWYALHFSQRYLGTKVTGMPPAPAWLARSAMEWLVPRAMFPAHPDLPLTTGIRLARRAGLVRYHWLRMPPRLLIPHLVRKSLRGLGERFSRPKD